MAVDRARSNGHGPGPMRVASTGWSVVLVGVAAALAGPPVHAEGNARTSTPTPPAGLIAPAVQDEGAVQTSTLSLDLLVQPLTAEQAATDEAVRTASAASGRSTWVEERYPPPRRPLTMALDADLALALGRDASGGYGHLTSTLDVRGGWRVAPDAQLTLGLAVTYEWTEEEAGRCRLGDCRVGDQNDADADDVTLALEHARLFDWDGLVVSGALSLSGPTSVASRAADHILTTGAELRAQRAFGPLTPHLGAGASAFFGLSDYPDASTGEGRLPRGRCRSIRDTDCLLLAGFVPSWRAGGELGLTVVLPEHLDLRIVGGLAVTAPAAGDETFFTNTRTNPGPIFAPAPDPRWTTSGVIELGYTLDDGVRLALGTASAQPATDDEDDVRFPFWDLVDADRDYSALYLAVGWAI